MARKSRRTVENKPGERMSATFNRESSVRRMPVALQRRENHAVVGVTGRFYEFGYFVFTQDRRQPHGPFGLNQIQLLIRPVQHLHEEKARGCDPCGTRFHGELSLIEQVKLKLPHMFLREQVRALFRVRAKSRTAKR